MQDDLLASLPPKDRVELDRLFALMSRAGTRIDATGSGAVAADDHAPGSKF
ncbi:hypothetical protein FRAAL3619 [Frankia alni ACN14a]|uniref:Uncharacterized protein n=1 Tax=Frankia alni (strain DSM 45986 / CECT 9034 / ACN14a) TaxID=326424 RepID=Q0RJQ0_FRAAA|nr:hypothetical protein FRAAL3619 [Frankia alni ACN14a]